MAAPRFRAAALVEGRQRLQLTQSQLAVRAVDETAAVGVLSAVERARRIRTWQSRIGAWEHGIDSPSASYVPTLARLIGVAPLALFDIEASEPTFEALRLSAGLTLQALAVATGISYTSLYRMSRGVAPLPPAVSSRLATVLGVSDADLVAAIARDL